MELSVVSKMKIIFNLLFSSFMFLEIFLFFLLLSILVIVNTKAKNLIVSILVLFLLVGGTLTFCIYFSTYFFTCIDSLLIKIMDYYYFPSTIIFFFIFLIMVIDFIYTLFNKKMNLLKKVINFICSSFICLFFSIFTSLAIINKIDLSDMLTLYQNKEILAVVQISNLIFLLWIIISFFYYLFFFFKKILSKKEIEN